MQSYLPSYLPPYSNLSFPQTIRRTYPSEEETYGIPTSEEFDIVVQQYLNRLSLKKRDKALIDEERYKMIREVLINPKDTSVSTAQFRFWVKKMFNFNGRCHQVIYHDEKPVATKEDIYGILVDAHREANHGGRDKTSAIVKFKYSWIPKELIARFVRCCPTCKVRRNGCNFNGNVSPPQFNYDAIYGTAQSAAAVAVAGSLYTPIMTASIASTPSPVNEQYFQYELYNNLQEPSNVLYSQFEQPKDNFSDLCSVLKPTDDISNDQVQSFIDSWNQKEQTTQENLYHC